jgi:type I restriction enzyme S subunit
MNLWNDYKKIPLPKVLSFIVDNRGKTVPTAKDGNHKLIATNCIRNENLYPSYEKIRLLSEDTYQTWFRAHPIPGDIIFVCKGTPGRICMVPDPIDFCIAQDMIAFRVDEKQIYNRYLLVVLRSREIQEQIANTSVGDVIPHFKKQFLDQLLIPLPPMDIQKKIGDLYFAMALKEELNKRINKNLLEQVRALYKDRFIDLMPFGGSMPSDWHLGTVSEIIELHDSKRIPLSSRERAELDKIYPYYGATSVMDYVDRYLFDGIYLLLGEDGTVVDGQGFPILQYVEGKFWVNNHAHIITGKNGFTVELLYLLFSLTNVQSIVTGAVQPKISQANLNKVPIVIPSEAELKAFDESIQPFFAEIRNLRAENDRLATVRDSMLPRLMSGELDVSDLDF